MKFKKHFESHKALRRSIRSNQTPAEQLLWQKLRGNKLGITFRRQVSLQRYIVDFFASKESLVIVVDGEIHNRPEAIEYDRIRSDYLVANGFHILRFSNDRIYADINSVLTEIAQRISCDS